MPVVAELGDHQEAVEVLVLMVVEEVEGDTPKMAVVEVVEIVCAPVERCLTMVAVMGV